jgi:hypothetical protein
MDDIVNLRYKSFKKMIIGRPGNTKRGREASPFWEIAFGGADAKKELQTVPDTT